MAPMKGTDAIARRRGRRVILLVLAIVCACFAPNRLIIVDTNDGLLRAVDVIGAGFHQP